MNELVLINLYEYYDVSGGRSNLLSAKISPRKKATKDETGKHF